MEPVRIAYLIHELEMGGTESHLVEVLRHLDRRAFDPLVFCLRHPGRLGEQVAASGVPLTAWGIQRIYDATALATVRRFARVLREQRVQILHTYLVSSNIYGTLVGRLAGVPHILTSRRDMGFSRNWRLALVETGIVNRLADRIVVVCDVLRQQVARELGTRPSKVVTIPNGVDVDAWTPLPLDPALRASVGLAPGDLVVGIVGVLAPVKGHRHFLEAAALVAPDHPPVKFLIVGDGPLRADCEQLAERLGIRDRVIFAGNRARSADLLGQIDVVVCSSLSEGMSMSLLEAMALAKPIVATRVGGNPEVVLDGETGLLVPPGDSRALAGAIRRLLAHPDTAARFGRRGRERAAQVFDVRQMVRRMEHLYAGLLGRVDPVVVPA